MNAAAPATTNVWTTGVTSAATAETGSLLQFFLFVAFAVAVTLGAYKLYQMYLAKMAANEVAPMDIVAPVAPAVTPSVDLQQTWCFVGADSGSRRWCVQVPSESACTADRSYRTRDACEATAM